MGLKTIKALVSFLGFILIYRNALEKNNPNMNFGKHQNDYLQRFSNSLSLDQDPKYISVFQGVVQDVSAVEIIETTPVEINLVLPVSDDVTGHVLAVNDGMEGEGHPTGEHVNISEYVNILIEPQDQEV